MAITADRMIRLALGDEEFTATDPVPYSIHEFAASLREFARGVTEMTQAKLKVRYDLDNADPEVATLVTALTGASAAKIDRMEDYMKLSHINERNIALYDLAGFRSFIGL